MSTPEVPARRDELLARLRLLDPAKIKAITIRTTREAQGFHDSFTESFHDMFKDGFDDNGFEDVFNDVFDNGFGDGFKDGFMDRWPDGFDDGAVVVLPTAEDVLEHLAAPLEAIRSIDLRLHGPEPKPERPE